MAVSTRLKLHSPKEAIPADNRLRDVAGLNPTAPSATKRLLKAMPDRATAGSRRGWLSKVGYRSAARALPGRARSQLRQPPRETSAVAARVEAWVSEKGISGWFVS